MNDPGFYPSGTSYIKHNRILSPSLYQEKMTDQVTGILKYKLYSTRLEAGELFT